jgi:hypothetical protein
MPGVNQSARQIQQTANPPESNLPSTQKPRGGVVEPATPGDQPPTSVHASDPESAAEPVDLEPADQSTAGSDRSRSWGPRGGTTKGPKRPGAERTTTDRVARPGTERRPGATSSSKGGASGWQARREGGRGNPLRNPAQSSADVNETLRQLLERGGTTDVNLDIHQLRALVDEINKRIQTLESVGDASLRIALQTILEQIRTQAVTPDESDEE